MAERKDGLYYTKYSHMGDTIIIYPYFVCNLANNKHGTIINSIIDVSFPKLSIIQLDGNLIESIECLSRISFPQLQNLRLNFNNINCISTLRKVNCPLIK